MPEKLISPSLRLSVTSPSLPDAWSPVSPGIMLYTPLSTPSVAASQHARPEALPPNDVQHDNKDNGGKMPVAVVADDRPDSCGAETSSLSSSSSSTPSLSLHHPPPPLPSPAGLHFPSPFAYAAAAASIPASTSSLSAPKRTPFALSLDHGPSASPSHLVLDQSSLTGSDLTGFSSPMDGSRSSPDPPGHSPASPSSSIANIPRRTSVEATSTTSQQQQRTSAALPIPVASSPSASSASTTNRHRVPNPSSPLSRSILHDDSEDDDATLCPETATTQTVSSASRRTPSTHAGSPRPKSLPPFPSSSRGSGSAASAGHSGPLKSPCFVHGYLAHSPFMPDFSGSVSGTSASDSNAHHQRAGPAGAGGSHVSPSSSLTSTTTSTSSHMGASPISPSSSLTGASSVAASTMGLHSSSSSASGAYEAKASSSSDRPSASQLHPSSHLAHSGNNTHDLAPHRTKSQLRLEGYEEAEDGVLVEPPTADGEDGAHERAEDESLTRQLAETAVGVREMAKALGRTTVRSRIQNVLIVTKARDNRLIKLTRELAIFLMNKIRNDSSPVGVSSASKRGLTVYVDAQLRNSKRFDAVGIERDYPQFFVPFERRRSSSSASVNTESGFLSGAATPNGFYNGNSNGSTASPSELGQLRYWTSDICSRSPHLFDFVVTLGGDGTVLFTSWLFQKIVPPVLPFALGSLGFLTNFDFANFSSVMDSVIDKGIRVNLRMRFTCTVYRAVAPEDDQARKKSVKAVKNAEGEILMSQVGKSGWEALEGGVMGVPNAVGLGEKKRDKEIMCFTTRPVEQFEVLNDLVVDRGPSPYVSLLELFGDEHHMTTVQADGLTVSTPTGSTAYSLSAGGSLVHPEIPALLITPICPHTLSFRPMLLPDSMELRICVPYNSRSTAWASFDGRGRVELKQGDHIKVTASKYPFPTVCADKQSTDWFHAIQRTLRWNEREKQKSFVVIEEPRAPKPLQPPRPLRAPMASVPKLSLNTGDEAEILESREGSEHLTDGREGGGSAITDEDQGEPEKLKEEEEEEEEDEKFDIDDSSSVAEPSAPVSPPMSATSSNGESSINHHRGPAGRPFDPSLHFTSATPAATFLPLPASGVASPDRFAPGPGRPHPPKLSPRHLTEALTKAAEDSSGASLPASSSHHHLEEKGQRDDINSGPGALRASGSRIPRQAERDLPLPPGSDAELRTPKPHQRMPVPHQHLVSPHRIVAAHHHQLQGHSSGPRRTASWGRRERRQREERAAAEQQEKDDQGPSRAFAFFGQDESDSGLSEGESDGGY